MHRVKTAALLFCLFIFLPLAASAQITVTFMADGVVIEKYPRLPGRMILPTDRDGDAYRRDGYELLGWQPEGAFAADNTTPIIFSGYYQITSSIVFIAHYAVDPTRINDPARIIYFPPLTGLERCLRDNYLSKNLKTVRKADLLAIKELYCDGYNFTSLSGLEEFNNLEVIDLGYRASGVSSLMPLSGLKKLKHIRVTRSNIASAAPISSLTALRYLDLSSNHITNLTPLSPLTELTTLLLYHQGPNYIDNISVLGGLTHLLALDLSSNKIDNITALTNLKELEYLNLRDNRIMRLPPLNNMSSLERINLSINALDNLSALASVRTLTEIYADSNRITNIEFVRGLYALNRLSLSRNRVTDLSPLARVRYQDNYTGCRYLPDPDNCSDYPQGLAILNFDINSLTSLEPLLYAIEHLRLKELDVSYNCIDRLDGYPLYLIKEVRKEHQCEEQRPLPTSYDLSLVVNSDLLMASAGGSAPVDDNLTQSIEEHGGGDDSSRLGPGGCSIARKKAGDLMIIIGAAIAAWLFLRRRTRT